jgi:hypothetical protein
VEAAGLVFEPRKLRRRQLTEDGNVEIGGRDLPRPHNLVSLDRQ